MKHLTAIVAAAKGITSGFFLSLITQQDELYALHRMEIAQQSAMRTLLRSTAALCDMDKQGRLARKIQDDE